MHSAIEKIIDQIKFHFFNSSLRVNDGDCGNQMNWKNFIKGNLIYKKSDVYGEWYLENYQVILKQYSKYLNQTKL